MSAGLARFDETNVLYLDGIWRLQHYRPGEMNPLEVAAAGLDDRYWITAHVPGDVHETLIRHRLIADPYYGHQDQLCRWVEQNEWWYRTTFDYELTDDRYERHELVLHGLDTFATVYINGHEIACTANMHRQYVLDVTRVLRNGWNSIAIRFDPLHLHYDHKEQFDWSSYTKERPWLRKAAMNFGWDWGPRLITVGIWDRVEIRRHRQAKLTDVYAYTVQADGKQAVLHVNAACQRIAPLRYTGFNVYRSVAARDQTNSGAVANVPSVMSSALSALSASSHNEREDSVAGHDQQRQPLPLALEAVIYDRDGREVASQRTVPISANQPHGMGGSSAEHVQLQLHITEPQLWWTHDLGEPYLYTLVITLYAGTEIVDRSQQSIGLRTVELQQRNEQGEPSFAFVLNGVRLYARGANWIPADNRIGAIADDRYRELIELSAAAHMNMLRVWAGGIYEKKVFYQLCDELGILVWQDFAFANALFPDFNDDYRRNVRAEVEDQVRRLRNHASLALWCGNNEIDWLYDMKTASGDIRSPFYGEAIYHELIPDTLAYLDPNRPYWPSSPYDGNDANDPNAGDRHNWQVWHGSVYPRSYGDVPLLDYSIEGVGFHHYKSDLALFSSEFGMHAAANPYTLSRYVPAESFYWGSAEMAYRNKDTNHRKGILLMEGYTGIPHNIEQYINYSMLTQAEGLKYGIEHYRRHKQRNGGSLIWQLNDSWPGTSWSIVDYELLPKAAYFYARGFYHPLLLCADHDPGQPFHVWIVNDRLQQLQTQVMVDVIDWQGTVISRHTADAQIGANEANCIGTWSEAELLQGKAMPNGVVIVLSCTHPDIRRNLYYLRAPLQLHLPTANWESMVDEQQGTVTITNGAVLARMIRIDLAQGRLRMDDNYFDLLPGERRTIGIHHAGGEVVRWDTLRISALNGEVGADA
ncbi:glycoside hydrolase family 2 protein [Paenibacillus sp. SGZ-1009]|uniref:glycoside hydrolase family 2 protein n=1 Tax=Paenibacillus campi TaxID=3106031 RepID=UPI002AFFB7E4|nr:glycoside hydrolase family 2 protein [Paenibacillus sp. SGZ-1009]